VGGGRKTGHRGPFSEEVLVGDDINVQTTVSFMDAAKGAQKEIRITPNVECPICSGSGTRPGTKKQECGRCGGTGTRVLFMQGGFQMATTCEACGGKGRVIPPGSECYSCHGSGVAKEKRTVTVEIPPGVEDGVRFRVSGEGHAPGTSSLEPGQSTKRGDLFVHIQVEPHEKFGRKGSDILYTSTIPMTTALLGGIIKIPTLDGEVELRVPSGTNTGDVIVMSTMGMKKLNLGRGRRGHGDLKVEFKVNMPK
jgi:molecular chaperone DnaJ